MDGMKESSISRLIGSVYTGITDTRTAAFDKNYQN